MDRYMVVRSYSEGNSQEKELQKLFDEGWQFLRASEYIKAAEGVHMKDIYLRPNGYIEYILYKKEYT